MANKTTPYKKTLSGSIGAGMGSLFSPGGKKYYILEHKVSSKYHKAGENQEIIVDNIELGRDSTCQVRFDESFKTVSRKHAAIVKDGDMWKIVPLSKTNTTYLNGQPIKEEWYLQNGDEIQLSTNGPKIGFITPTGKKSTVGSIGLTRRMSLFRQQALRPYKNAIAVLGLVLIGIGTAGGIIIYHQGEKLKDNSVLIAEAQEANAKNEALIAEQQKLLEEQGEGLAAQSHLIDSLKKVKPTTIVKYVQPKNENGVDMSPYAPYVYHITEYIPYNGEYVKYSYGTGFLLNDGKFVTARHVVSPYYSNDFYIEDGKVVPRTDDDEAIYLSLLFNTLAQAGKFTTKYECVSPNDKFTFTSDNVSQVGKYDEIHTLKEPFRVIRKGEVVAEIPAGTQIRIGAHGQMDHAYVNTGKSGGLVANRQKSTTMKQGTNLYILGYPNGWGKGSPIFSQAVTSMDGLSKEFGNTIMVSNNNTEGGNSGGPIFAQGENGMEVVALVSGRIAEKGNFVPISVIP